MAEALLKERLEKSGRADGWEVRSAGVWAVDGIPATSNAQEVMQEMGLDLSDHSAKLVEPDLLAEIDLVLVMEKRHRSAILERNPELSDRVYLLTEMVGREDDFEDPVGGTLETYRESALALKNIIEEGFERILQSAADSDDPGE